MSETINFRTVELHGYPDHVGVFVLPKAGDIEKIGQGFVVKRGGVQEFTARAWSAESGVLKDFRP